MRKGYENFSDITHLKVKGIIEKVDKQERYLRCAEKGTRLAVM